MLKGLWFLLKCCWRFNKIYVIDICLLQIISAIVPLASVVLPKYIIDELMLGKKVDKIILYIGILVVGNFFGNVLISFLRGRSQIDKGIIFNKFQVMMTENLIEADYENIESAAFLDTKEKAKKFLYANGQGFGVALDNAMNIIGKLFTFIGLSTILMTLNPMIVIVFISLILLNTLVESKVRTKYVTWDMEKAPIERKTFYLLSMIEDFRFGKEIRLYNLKDWLIEKVQNHLNDSNAFYKRQIKHLMKSQYFSRLTELVREIVSYGYLAYMVISKNINIGDFTMYLNAMVRFSGAMNEVMTNIIEIRQFDSYYDELEKYMNMPKKIRSGKKEGLPNDYGIEFKNVSFRYEGQSTYALRDINITIQPGEKLSIVGENGAGKSTFVKLICRLYEPTEGAILLGGVDIKDISYEKYMNILSAVFQDFKLFSFNIKENIVFNNKDVNNKYIEELLIENGLGDKLEKLPMGIESNLYKNFYNDGFEPSGGEAQKIALARAIYKDAKIVILDEPTAAMDPRAEYEIYQRFNQMVEGKTALYISHRLSSSKFCDKIALFENGSISELGTHNELIKSDKKYAELFNMQAQFYIN